MNTGKLLISTASWEPRFLAGVRRILDQEQVAGALCFWFSEYGTRTAEAREEFAKLLSPRPTHFIELPMYLTESRLGGHSIPAYVVVWREINKAIMEWMGNYGSFILDITTMPREAMWMALDLLTEAAIAGKLVYHRAAEHGDWCGAEPEQPHIVPKLGGLPALNLPTRLMIVSGYDEDRSEQFIGSYEPCETVILFQEFVSGTHEENREKNEMRHRRRFGDRGRAIRFKGVNCYGPDWGFAQILAEAREFGKCSNLILASLGPKTSAISVYRVLRSLPEACLIYAPCRSYNLEYSKGIGETLALDWPRADQLMGAPAL